ncbi:MAG: hypothetical protein ABSD85_11545 [Acidimicrobiales bacterium]|jgi:hypothetical protein
MADRIGAAVLGIIHVNKSGAGDAINQIMGSRAFGAVCRAALFAIEDPDAGDTYVLGLPKHNLGPRMPSFTYKIEEVEVGKHADGDITATKIVWQGATDRQIDDLLEDGGRRSGLAPVGNAADVWLRTYLESRGGRRAPSQEVKGAGKLSGFSESALKRARVRVGVTIESCGFQGGTWWMLPGNPDSVVPSERTPAIQAT